MVDRAAAGIESKTVLVMRLVNRQWCECIKKVLLHKQELGHEVARKLVHNHGTFFSFEFKKFFSELTISVNFLESREYFNRDQQQVRERQQLWQQAVYDAAQHLPAWTVPRPPLILRPHQLWERGGNC